MKDRADLMAWLRSELIGPSQTPAEPTLVQFTDLVFTDTLLQRRGPLFWQPPAGEVQEVLYYERETPHRKYGAGALHPGPVADVTVVSPPEAAAAAGDTLGVDSGGELVDDEGGGEDADESDNVPDDAAVENANPQDPSDDFDISSPDVRHPTTLGISFCAALGREGRIVVRLPQSQTLDWQRDQAGFAVNGRYEPCKRRWVDDMGQIKESPMWRRWPAVPAAARVVVQAAEMAAGRVIQRRVQMPEGSPIALRIDLFPRAISGSEAWLVTLVLRNVSQPAGQEAFRRAVLYQAYFEVEVESGTFVPYPESSRPFEQLDRDEQSLALLYRNSATWAIGHGCAAAWKDEPDGVPKAIAADVMPAVQLPSMTPDIENQDGVPIKLSMRELSGLPDGGEGPAWDSLGSISREYRGWIALRRAEIAGLPQRLQGVALRHLDGCEACLARIEAGIDLLRRNAQVRKAFRLANLGMLLQQIATKKLSRRLLDWDSATRKVAPAGPYLSPWDAYQRREEGSDLGWWRAFQIAFLLMSLEGLSEPSSPDREIVDLIWFPTGGGKTEAYLGVMAYHIIMQRLVMEDEREVARDGTNVIMRYTLRMLTTQQFQRGASLICALEFLRRNPDLHGEGQLLGKRFSLGLWIGTDGSPNKISEAKSKVGAFKRGDLEGNPLVLTDCPWCRSEIGRYDGSKPQLSPRLSDAQWNAQRLRGITEVTGAGPLLHCSDRRCAFGSEQWSDWLPVEVIDERIYQYPPTLVIGTADKLAIVAYRPMAGALFGKGFREGRSVQVSMPPSLIVQDELHLIAGPLGTMYALYEGVFERLCSVDVGGDFVKPKIIASTATIRGAADQVLALYGRGDTRLFPAPGFDMGDSFFGTYARDEQRRLRPGRAYLGIHANDYGSILTTQVRTFAGALFQPFTLPEARRDPWWTLLVFYNSIRELGGAKTLFDSDIRSRLKFLFNREGYGTQNRRTLRIVEELTSRLSQAEIVGMLDKLSVACSADNQRVLDACLASNIIEVGIDIDRLSVMGVVGQPKTTAQYIQVTGRVGRRWGERPGLILMIYNPGKSRDRSHFEQFHSYHRRLYERVEPTSATPFAVSAVQRALPGALLTWARQYCDAAVQDWAAYVEPIEEAYQLLRERCANVQAPEDVERSLRELERVRADLNRKWRLNPQSWEEFPPAIDGEYLMLWPGQFASRLQRDRGVPVASSMRQVDRSAELAITEGYALGAASDIGE